MGITPENERLALLIKLAEAWQAATPDKREAALQLAHQWQQEEGGRIAVTATLDGGAA